MKYLLSIRVSVLFFLECGGSNEFLEAIKMNHTRIKIDLGNQKTDLLNGCMVIKKKVVLLHRVKKYVPLKKTMMNNDLPGHYVRKVLSNADSSTARQTPAV